MDDFSKRESGNIALGERGAMKISAPMCPHKRHHTDSQRPSSAPLVVVADGTAIIELWNCPLSEQDDGG
jgi:hypothetical protein